MEEYLLTEEEVKLIEDFRKKKAINEKELKVKIDEFIDLSNKTFKVTEYLYGLLETNKQAETFIRKELNTTFLTDMYDISTEYKED